MSTDHTEKIAIDQSKLTTLGNIAAFVDAALESSATGREAFEALRTRNSKAPALARQTIIELLSQAVHMDRAALVSDAGGEPDAPPKWFIEAHGELSRSVNTLISACDRLLEAYQKGLVQVFLSHGALLNNYELQKVEKAELARRVVDKFFKPSALRCFIQASTMTIHLGEQLGKSSEVPGGGLFYTNSIVFPITVLREQGPYHVWTFCGKNYDEKCGGWLFPTDDKETERHLRELFGRGDGQLTTAFVAPIATTVEEGIYFHRHDTAGLVRILAENAGHLVIMSLADRIYPDRTHEGTTAWCPCRQWGGFQGRVSLVIGRDSAEKPMDQLARQLHDKGVDVQWLDHATGDWKHLPRKPSS